MSNCRKTLLALTGSVMLITCLSGCACRPGRIGPYGGVHPARCWVW